MMIGSSAAMANATNRASGRSFSRSATLRSMINSAPAPSLIWDELPAVITPSALKAAFNVAIFSSVLPVRIPSSRVRCVGPFSVSIGTGVISLQKRPSSVARAARAWLSRLNSSSSVRLIFQRSAIISAPMP